MTDAAPPVLPEGRLDLALAYASLGWQVIPITPGKKYPPMKDWPSVATDDIEQIREWWDTGGAFTDHGIGIVTGPASGFWVLDVDVSGDKRGDLSLREMNHVNGKLPPTVTARTGSGGLHLLFEWDPERPVTNGLATQLGAGLDIRGLGGQIVVAPSVHPITGDAYGWHEERHPWALAPSGAPDWLYELIMPAPPREAPQEAPEPAGDNLVELFDRHMAVEHLIRDDEPRPGTSVPAVLPQPTGETPAQWIRRSTDWHQVLGSDGWQVHHESGGDTFWTRPGKALRAGHSAVLHEPDGPFVVFTTEVDPAIARTGTPTNDNSGISFSVFDWLAATRHGGDRQALASAARAEMNALLPTPIRPPQPVDPTVDVGGDVAVDEVFTSFGHWWDHPEPTKTADMLTRTDGIGLLYTDELNWIHGDSGSGKTWVAVYAVAQLLRAGHHVAWIHYEDPTPALMVTRLKAFGLDRATVLERFHYHDPQGMPLDIGLLVSSCQIHSVAHVFLDSVGEALSASSIDENHDSEIGPWINAGPRVFVNAGIGVTCIDHGTKAGTYKLYPAGSKRKRAAVTGAGLLVEATKTPPTQSSNGNIRIISAKDRHGNLAQGTQVGMLQLDHSITTGHFEAAINVPNDPTEHTRVSATKELLRIVAKDPGLSSNEVIKLMPSMARARKLELIQAAIDDGKVMVELGPRGSRHLYPKPTQSDDTTTEGGETTGSGGLGTRQNQSSEPVARTSETEPDLPSDQGEHPQG